MNQTENAKRFAMLHVKGSPLLLYNAWDAGSAKAVAEAGAKAIATSSWSVAEAQGYRDGELIPIALAEQIVGQIAATIDLPVNGAGLYDIRRQAERITTIRETAQERDVELFINARTDVFLGQGRDEAQSVAEVCPVVWEGRHREVPPIPIFDPKRTFSGMERSPAMCH